MYISRRVDIIGPPVWKSTISPCLSKSELVSLRPWQSECQRRTLSPLHHHMLTPPRYPTAPSHTRNPSDIERDTIHHHGDIPLPPPCCSMGFCPHIPGSCPCLRFHPHQSRVSSPPGVLSPPKVSSSPSMVHDHTFAAAWRVVGGCCFYEGKGPLVRSWGEC